MLGRGPCPAQTGRALPSTFISDIGENLFGRGERDDALGRNTSSARPRDRVGHGSKPLAAVEDRREAVDPRAVRARARDHVANARRGKEFLAAERVYLRAPQLEVRRRERHSRPRVHRLHRATTGAERACGDRRRDVRRRHRRETACGGHEFPLPGRPSADPTETLPIDALTLLPFPPMSSLRVPTLSRGACTTTPVRRSAGSVR